MSTPPISAHQRLTQIIQSLGVIEDQMADAIERRDLPLYEGKLADLAEQSQLLAELVETL